MTALSRSKITTAILSFINSEICHYVFFYADYISGTCFDLLQVEFK